MLYISLVQFICSATYNNHNGDHFGRRENILYGHAQIYAVAVDDEDAHWIAYVCFCVRFKWRKTRREIENEEFNISAGDSEAKYI